MTIQSLWVGDALTPMERLSLSSFVAHGHNVDLFVYDDVANVPDGVTLRDAAEVLLRSAIFRYADSGSLAGFSNSFRYKLLLERGGWWVDTDVVCVQPFDFDSEHVFASELSHGAPVVTSCVIRAPAGSPAVEQAWQTCAASDPATLVWGQTGPNLCAEVVRAHGLESFVQPPAVFCPIPFYEWRTLIDPSAEVAIPAESRAVHLWNEMWRRGGVDKSAAFDRDCLYERLKTAPCPPSSTAALLITTNNR
jgi:hypothetical protein